jgi:multiple sugar transport system ATP-binding protein
VALGRAIVRAPRAFLLDEPLSNLDPVLRASARAELALLHRRLAATIVYVTHDQEEAMTLGTRIAIMRDGRVEQLAAPLDAFRQPANVFVAGFIGSPAMNFWRCRVSPAGAGMRAASPAFSIEMERVDIMPLDGGPVVVGVRPHDIDLTDPADGDGRGTVEVVEPLGAATLIHLRADGQPDGLVRVVSSPDIRIVIGDHVGFRLRRDRLHLFDEGEGRRVN